MTELIKNKFCSYKCFCKKEDNILNENYEEKINCIIENYKVYLKSRNLFESIKNIDILDKIKIFSTKYINFKPLFSFYIAENDVCLEISEPIEHINLIMFLNSNDDLINLTNYICCEEFITFVNDHINILNYETPFLEKYRSAHLFFENLTKIKY